VSVTYIAIPNAGPAGLHSGPHSSSINGGVGTGGGGGRGLPLYLPVSSPVSVIAGTSTTRTWTWIGRHQRAQQQHQTRTRTTSGGPDGEVGEHGPQQDTLLVPHKEPASVAASMAVRYRYSGGMVSAAASAAAAAASASAVSMSVSAEDRQYLWRPSLLPVVVASVQGSPHVRTSASASAVTSTSMLFKFQSPQHHLASLQGDLYN
jgi:hypothetical protein